MLITNANAQEAAQAAVQSPDALMSWLPLIFVFVIFYFLVMRPASRRQREHRELISSLKKGDDVLTSAGIMGKVTKVIDDNFIQVEIADGVKVKMDKSYVSDCLNTDKKSAK